MSEMVARVARAIDEAFSQQSDREDRHYDVPIGWTTAAAIAAIEAMREPTDAMLDAGYEADEMGPYGYWAMMQAALKE